MAKYRSLLVLKGPRKYEGVEEQRLRLTRGPTLLIDLPISGESFGNRLPIPSKDRLEIPIEISAYEVMRFFDCSGVKSREMGAEEEDPSI